MIEVKGLCFERNSRIILNNINLTVNDGEVVGIVGPSGCGKSFLLRSIIELEKADSGLVLIDGDKLKRTKNGDLIDPGKIGLVFQYFNLFNHLSVLENVTSPLIDLCNMDKHEAIDKAKSILSSIGLAEHCYSYPESLSGGQKQRAAIARTLALDPDIILFDEPTSSLDPLMKGEVESVIRMLASQGRTMIIVSHEMELIRSVCSRVLFMSNGAIIEDGTTREVFDNPKNIETKRFLKNLRVLELSIESKDFDFIGISTIINQYVFKNGISDGLRNRLSAVLEELLQMIIIQPAEENRMNISFEYNRANLNINGIVKCTGPYIDPDDPVNFFSWPIIAKRATKISLEMLENDPDGYTNLIKIALK